MADLIVAKEAAEADFERLCRLRRIDLDQTDMTQEELDRFARMRNRVVKEVSLGHLVVDDDGIATYTPPVSDAKPLKFRMATAATFVARDDAKDKGDNHQMMAMLAQLTGWSKPDLAKLAPPDYAFCSMLVGLFLG